MQTDSKGVRGTSGTGVSTSATSVRSDWAARRMAGTLIQACATSVVRLV